MTFRVFGKNIANVYPWLKQLAIDNFLRLYARKLKTFTQVGAGGGGDLTCRLANKHGWRGVIVEPHNIIEEAKKKYDLRKVKAFQVAIADEIGSVDLYMTGEEQKGRSLYFGVADSRGDDVFSQQVTGWTLDKLYAEAGFAGTDFFICDTEGYDASIVSQLLARKHKPLVIVYESKHLALQLQERVIQLLQSNNYRVFTGLNDTLAVRRGGNKK